MRLARLALLLCGCILGCTHMQLQKDTVGQFRTVSDLYQQQVMDNLAMFAHDPGALPYFCVLSTGNNSVTDMGSALSTLTLGRAINNLFMVTQEGTTLGLSRNISEGWGVNAVSDPRRLELMRCAYQKEISAYGANPRSEGSLGNECPDCKHRFDIFYGVPDADKPDPAGRVTIACLAKGPAWFGVGRKCDVPKACDCAPVGHFCDTYVWVLPGGRDELSKLTLAILDYATNQPTILTKEVSYYIDGDGRPIASDSKSAVGSVRVTVPYTVSNKEVLSAGTATHAQQKAVFDQAAHPTEIPRPPEVFQNSQPPDFQFLNQRLQLLNPPR